MEKWGLKFGQMVSKVKPGDVVRSWKIFRGDTVHVTSGKSKGLEGKVTEIRRPLNLVFVEGANIARKHVATNPLGKGEIYSIEQGIHVSNVALIDPVEKKPTRAGWKMITDENGFEKKIRFSKLSGKEIPIPTPPPRKRQHSEFATLPEDVAKVTFVPNLTQAPIPEGCHL